MRFGLTDDDVALQDMARGFADEHMKPHAIAWDRDKHFPVDILRKAAALGMGAVYVAEADGGSGLSRLQATLIFEALATGCPTVAAYLSIHNMCTAMVARLGTASQKQRWLPGLVSMDLLSSYCLTEPGAGSDAAALRTRASRDGDHYVLNGQKQFISGAGNPHGFYIVMARTGADGPKGISTLVVERDTPGLSFGANEHKMGWNAQPTRTVTFEDVRVPVENRLGAEGDGFKIAMSALDGGRLNIAACSLGGAQAACDTAVAYMGDRKAFGQRLADFQALRFKVADMATGLEVSRLFLYAAADAVDTDAPGKTARVAMAKAFVTDRCFEVANDALQLLGGYGYLSDYGIEKIVRDLRVHQILEGTNEIMRTIIARDVLDGKVGGT
jgi:alkylation response protein AidB-like acyl-CoA dehydrogenase